ncbi:hypothetical protein [Muriicola sp.]|uniref:hypothetical protein n=1 Tax=Muriicola sp. TaxID=2020856 RepID=UPI003C7487C2
MAKEYTTSLELLKYAASISLYEKLVVQLRKDFGLANINLDLPENVGPLELKTILKEKIYVLLLERFTDYLNLLYVVDVPEKAFSAIESTDVVEVAEKVSYLVLKREWQKVWLKQSYDSGNHNA